MGLINSWKDFINSEKEIKKKKLKHDEKFENCEKFQVNRRILK